MRGYEEKPMMGLGCYVGDLVEGPRQPGICSRLSGIIESRGQPWPGRAPLVRASSQFTKVVGSIPGQGTHKNQTVMKQKSRGQFCDWVLCEWCSNLISVCS